MEDPFAIPRAFEGMPRNEAILAPSLSVASVVVEIPRGLENSFGDEIKDKVVRALSARDIATQSESRGVSWTLRARYAGTFMADKRSPRVGVIVWRLLDKEMVLRDQFTTTFTGDTADTVVPRLADQASVVGDKVVAALSLPPDAGGAGPAGVADKVRVRIGRIAGAPGDGNRALALALEGALRERGAKIERDQGSGLWRVDCVVTVARLSATEDRVKLVWKLVAADGKEAGTLVQENPVERGRLGRKWGPIAAFAAEAAADGMWQVLQQIRPVGGS